MNLGNKIKELRNNKNLTVEELAKALDVSTETIIEYENNELEPTLDKKIILCQVLDTSLDELSIKLERKPKPIDRYEADDITEEKTTVLPTEEIVEENLIATTSIIYNEKIFDSMFKSDFKRFLTQTIISIVSYITFAIIALVLNASIFYIFFFGLAILNIIKFMMNQSRFKNNKIEWLEQFDNVKKEYYFYESFVDVTSSDTDTACTRFEYSALYRIIERDAVILCIFNTVPKAILTIVKSNVDEETINKIRAVLRKNCENYVEIDPITKEDKMTAKKQEKIKLLLNIAIILCFVGYFCSNIIYNSFNLDDTLEVNLILYSIAMLFPLFCLVVYFIAKKKFNVKSTKTLVIGIIVLVLCIFNLASAYISHVMYKMNNNDKLVEEIESTTSVDLPDYYYTIYLDKTLENEQKEGYEIKFDSYQIWTFSKKQELKQFTEAIKTSSNWFKQEDYSQEIIELDDDAKDFLKMFMYETPDKADYYSLIENDGKYIFMAFYNSDNANYMLTVEYSKTAISD